MKVMILAGGKGSRLWPLSHDILPKQFLKIGSSESLLVETVKRLLTFCSQDEICIVTNQSFSALAKNEIENHFDFTPLIIEEPVSKNTAFAILYSIVKLKEMGAILDDEPILFCPSDHHFTQVDEIAKCVLSIKEKSNCENIYLLGVRPTKPETGYGYISLGKHISGREYEVSQFHEKPTTELAASYIESGNTLWNTGIFILNFLALHAELVEKNSGYYNLFQSGEFTQLPSISFDHLVLEKSHNIHVFSLKMDFKDIGSFDALYAHLDKDELKNSSLGEAHFVNSSRNLVISERNRIGLIDVDDLIVADSFDGICIAKRGSSQKVSAVKSHFKKSNQAQLFTIDCHPTYLLQKLIIPQNCNYQFLSKYPTKIKLVWGFDLCIQGESLALHQALEVENKSQVEIKNNGKSEAILYLFCKTC